MIVFTPVALPELTAVALTVMRPFVVGAWASATATPVPAAYFRELLAIHEELVHVTVEVEHDPEG